jgi:hypothetical protein
MTAEERAELERWEATLPEGEDDMTPEQRAELAAIVAQYEAGTLPVVAQDDVPAFLEQMARARAAADSSEDCCELRLPPSRSCLRSTIGSPAPPRPPGSHA